MPEYSTLDSWDRPVYSNSQAPLGPAQLTEVANLAMGRGARVFATLAAAVSAAPTAPANALGTVLTLPGVVIVFDGAGNWKWTGTAEVASDTARDAAIPGTPIQGMRVHRADNLWVEEYFAIYNVSTNPAGAVVAGWYPVFGALPTARAKRSTTARTLSTSWRDESTTTYWTTDHILNVAAYSDGWTVPVSGFYRVGVSIAASDAIFVSVGNGGAAPTGRTDGFLEASAGVGGFATAKAEASIVKRLTAGEKLRLSVISASASTWQTGTTGVDASHFELAYIAPPNGA